MADYFSLDNIARKMFRVIRFLANIMPAAIMCSSGLSFRGYQRTDGHIWTIILAMLAMSSGISAILYHSALKRAKFDRNALIMAIFSFARLIPYTGTGLPPCHQLETVFKDYLMLVTCWAAVLALSTYNSPREERMDLSPENLIPGLPWLIGTFSWAVNPDNEDSDIFSSHGDIFYADSVTFKHTGPDSTPPSFSSGSESNISLTGAQQNDPDRNAMLKRIIDDCQGLERTQVVPTL